MATVKLNVQSLTALGMSRTDIEALRFALERAVTVAGASSTNTPDAIVQRDGSGNFSAGTITASLTGTASNASALGGVPAASYATDADVAATYAPLSGAGASGTWSIGITGNAATATNSSQLGGVAAANYLQNSAIGVTVQAYDADLTAWAGKTAPSGTAVGDTDTQTLTNKTLTAAALGGTTDVSGGQLKFPATQSASSDANTLDDYEEGSFTPVLTFATPGNLAVTYSTQTGFYTKVGRQVTVTILIITSAFTHTTASGNATITGLPFTSMSTSGSATRGLCAFAGITKAGYTQVVSALGASASSLTLRASGSGVAIGSVLAADMPTGGTVNIEISHTYFTA